MTAIPSNKQLILNQVACYIQTTVTSFIRLRVVVASPSGSASGPDSPLVPTVVGATSTVRYWQLNQPVQLLVRPGYRPKIDVQVQQGNTDIFLIDCTITGTISNAPA